MLKLVLSLTGLLAGFWLMGCKSEDEAVREAENEVFAIHDEVMPHIDDIMELKKRLNQRVASADSLKASGSAASALRSEEDKEQAMRLRKNLIDADSLMMSWMNRYNGDTLAKLSSEEAMRYLSDQKDQINNVKDKVNSSIEQARSYLGRD